MCLSELMLVRADLRSIKRERGRKKERKVKVRKECILARLSLLSQLNTAISFILAQIYTSLIAVKLVAFRRQ